jgi:hypothetical protein
MISYFATESPCLLVEFHISSPCAAMVSKMQSVAKSVANGFCRFCGLPLGRQVAPVLGRFW